MEENKDKQYIQKLERLFYDNMSGGASREACDLWNEIDAKMPKPKPIPAAFDTDGYPIEFNRKDLNG